MSKQGMHDLRRTPLRHQMMFDVHLGRVRVGQVAREWDVKSHRSTYPQMARALNFLQETEILRFSGSSVFLTEFGDAVLYYWDAKYGQAKR